MSTTDYCKECGAYVRHDQDFCPDCQDILNLYEDPIEDDWDDKDDDLEYLWVPPELGE